MFFYIVGYLISCWLLADFISGLYHWSEDRYAFSSFITSGDFQNHHKNPLDFLQDGFFLRNISPFIFAAIAVIIFIFLYPPMITVAVMAGFSQQIHALAHKKGKNNKFVVCLQEIGIFQSPKRHSVHHKTPYDCNYCIMSNYVNPLLEFVNFWFYLERLLLKFGISPKFPENYIRTKKGE